VTFPGRADRICVINAPNFRNVAYLVFPLVPKEVKAKIEILGRKYHDRLREILVPNEMPREYGGESDVPLGEWVLEKHIDAMYRDPQRRFPSYEGPPLIGAISGPGLGSALGSGGDAAGEGADEHEAAVAAAVAEEQASPEKAPVELDDTNTEEDGSLSL